MSCYTVRAERVAISQHGTSILFTSHLQDRLVVNLYIPHNRQTPLQAEEALGHNNDTCTSKFRFYCTLFYGWDCILFLKKRERYGHDCMVVGFKYLSPLTLWVWNPFHCEVHSIQHYVIKFIRYLRQVSCFIQVLWFPPPIKVTSTK
jgi:hypothetical protein